MGMKNWSELKLFIIWEQRDSGITVVTCYFFQFLGNIIHFCGHYTKVIDCRMPQVTNQNQLFPKGNFITNASLKTFSTKCLLLNKHKFTITHSTSQAHIRRAIHRHDRYLTLLRSVFLPLRQLVWIYPRLCRQNQSGLASRVLPLRPDPGGSDLGDAVSHHLPGPCHRNKAATRWWTPLKPGSGSMLELQAPSWIQMKKRPNIQMSLPFKDLSLLFLFSSDIQ